MPNKEYIGKVISITTIDGLVYTGKVVELDGTEVSESHELEIDIDFAGGMMI